MRWTQSVRQATRTYEYTVDLNGLLYLAGTPIRNHVTANKDNLFLDLFFKRLELNLQETDEDKELWQRGYRHVSLCQGERNYTASDATPVVFKDLVNDELRWAGTLNLPFQPSKLAFSSATGHFFHTSPPSRRTRDGKNPYGEWSLIASPLVMAKFERSLRVDSEGRASFEWADKRWDIARVD